MFSGKHDLLASFVRLSSFPFFLFFPFLPHFLPQHCIARGILVPWPGIKPVPPALEAWSPNYWTSRKVPELKSFRGQKFNKEDRFSLLI